MALPKNLQDQLRLPVIAAPMFLVSGPNLVTAACRAGIVGAFPTLNARTLDVLDDWLSEITTTLEDLKRSGANQIIAPYAANLIVHKTNARAADDLALVEKYKAPLVITSVGHPGDTAERIHAYGGIIFHDVINLHHAKKAAEAGVDGLILVCAGAGGHAGLMNPLTFVAQIREFFDGIVIVAGAISNGQAVRAVEVMGADLAYLGTRFIACKESMADEDYSGMLVEAESKDIVYTDKVSGIHGNFIRQSLEQAGLVDGAVLNDDEFAHVDEKKKAWKQIWSAGQGVGEIQSVESVETLVSELESEYKEAKAMH